ncbi:hypothetical protein VNI00_013732 [Paramarasmius palmivorus]|uniref:Cytochrome P450 n=1 Tax=Paramarasmius palmivorus TaxID=297713 RepID=A0AAW0BY39_9AGAR
MGFLPLLSGVFLYIPLLFLSLSIFFVVRSRRRSLNFLRGPPNTSVLLGTEYDLTQQFEIKAGLMFQWLREYGEVFRAKTVFNEDMIVVADSKALQHIFHKSSYRYPKSTDSTYASTKIFGPGVATVQAPVHQRQRKILNPAFSQAQIKPFVGIFQKVTMSLINQWREQLASGIEVIDATKYFSNLTLDALGETVFDYDFGALESKNNQLAYMVRNLFVDSVRPTKVRYLWNRIRSHFLPKAIEKSLSKLYVTKEDARWKAWLQASQSEAKKLYKNKLQGQTSEENDILGVISRSLESQDPEKRMDAQEALSQMATIILAGHETSGNTLTWLFYELSRNPDDQRRLFREIQEAREHKGELTASDYDAMPFLNAVIKETLRLHPIVLRLIREAEDDDVIPLAQPVVSTSGEMLTEIPVTKGQRVMVSIIGYNYSKAVWGEDAEEWNPARHLDAKRTTTLGVFGNLMSFSAGVRSCIGWRFAVHEMQTVTAMLVESFEFSIDPSLDIMMVDAGFVAPMVRDRLKEGFQLPLKLKIRE